LVADGIGIRNISPAHQQAPPVPPAPQSNGKPQRVQVMRLAVQVDSGLTAFMASTLRFDHAGIAAGVIAS
jgi:hypothetical protein